MQRGRRLVLRGRRNGPRPDGLLMNMRWRAVLCGAAAFLAAHTVERVEWASWFADHSMVAWFTNSGRAVLMTMAFMAVAEVVGGGPAKSRTELIAGAANVAGGGIVAMIAALIAT